MKANSKIKGNYHHRTIGANYSIHEKTNLIILLFFLISEIARHGAQIYLNSPNIATKAKLISDKLFVLTLSTFFSHGNLIRYEDKAAEIDNYNYTESTLQQ